MRSFVKSALLGIVIGAVAAGAFKLANAQPLQVAVGSKSGTYMAMAQQLKAACSNPAVDLKETTGSPENIALLTGNQVNLAWVQSDLLFFTKATDAAKVANVRTLIGFHPEELHFIARADTKKEGGYGIGSYRVGGKDVTFNTLSDLRGRPVGAVGGSVLSGRVVAQRSGLGFEVVEYPNNDTLKAALTAGKIDSILVVGGAPHPLVASLDQNFRLLPVSSDMQEILKSIYSPAVLSYSNLNQAGVPGISTQALLVSRVYNSQTMLAKLKELRTCFESKLGDIQDATGTHPKWQAVKASEGGKWDMYQLK